MLETDSVNGTNRMWCFTVFMQKRRCDSPNKYKIRSEQVRCTLKENHSVRGQQSKKPFKMMRFLLCYFFFFLNGKTQSQLQSLLCIFTVCVDKTFLRFCILSCLRQANNRKVIINNRIYYPSMYTNIFMGAVKHNAILFHSKPSH